MCEDCLQREGKYTFVNIEHARKVTLLTTYMVSRTACRPRARSCLWKQENSEIALTHRV